MGRCPLMGSYGMVIMLFAQVMYTCVTRKCAIKRSVTSTPGARTTPTSDASAVAVTTATLVTATAASRKVSQCSFVSRYQSGKVLHYHSTITHTHAYFKTKIVKKHISKDASQCCFCVLQRLSVTR